MAFPDRETVPWERFWEELDKLAHTPDVGDEREEYYR